MASDSSEKQTLSFLLRRFKEAGIQPRAQLGQNFLIDMNLQQLLLDTAAIGPDDVVLEIGTGTGGLTVLMAPRAAAVVTVEIDRALFQLAGEELFDFQNVVMVLADALRGKNHLNPDVLDAVALQMAAAPSRRFKLVANLPYHAATPILGNLLTLDQPPRTMTCTIQKEVADRLVALPGTKDYGALAIWVQSQCRAEIVRVLPPSVFWPRPKVSSAFVQLTVDDARRARIPDRAFFHDFVRSVFMHRRKVLRSELSSTYKTLGKPEVDELLAQLAISPNARAETIDPDGILALCEAVRGRLAAKAG